MKELKKVLIITYYWPPSGGAGVQRWLKFSKYLPEFGWEPIIFTPENPGFDLKDESLLNEVREDIEVLKFPIWEPYSLFKTISRQKKLNQGQLLEHSKHSFLKKLAIWVRGNFFIPDPKRFWVKPAVNYLSDILQTNDIKHIVTSGPPHSMHLVGKGLKLKNPSLTWIADFRDPWSEWSILNQMYLTSIVKKKHEKLEREVLKMADLTLATGPTAASEFKKLGARRVDYVTNGYDDSDLTQSDDQVSDKFIISHVGMLNAERNPIGFWEVLEELCGEPTFYKRFELRLTGILSQKVLESIQRHKRLSQRLVVKDSVPHQEVFKEYSQANILLLVQSFKNAQTSQLPGKLFEYLSVRRPILGIGEKDSDVSIILDETNSGQLFEAMNKEGLKNFILTQNGSGASSFTYEGVEQYERKALTGKLTQLLNAL